MRKAINPQMKLGQVDISQIEFDMKSRDEIPRLLMGLQYIWTELELRRKALAILEEMIPEGVDTENGRPGMELWTILVLGTIRLNCDWDYDKLKEIADNHRTVRLMLGHGVEDEEYRFPMQTMRDNVSLLTLEVLDKINQLVVDAGHNLVKKKEEKLRARCDSFVVETDVHFPTDINLLLDAMRKVITLIAGVCEALGWTIWRQSAYILRKLHKLYRRAQKLKKSKSKDEKQIRKRQKQIEKAHREYIEEAEEQLEKARATVVLIRSHGGIVQYIIADEIERYIRHAERQIDQIRRRVIEDKRIAHEEKVFSIFEEHTEWIQKGKAGVLQELGVKVCVVEDQYRFILYHQVMQKLTDEQIAVPIVQETKRRYPELAACSFDKGFYTPENLRRLRELLDLVVLPKKGRATEAERAEWSSEEYRRQRRGHAAVESGISALENHGLDRCRDHGIWGFERYVALAVVARNIQNLGNILLERKREEQKRQQGRLLRKAS